MAGYAGTIRRRAQPDGLTTVSDRRTRIVLVLYQAQR